MLILEPRVSDDETPESEASIGTADSSENITMETKGATSDPSGNCVCFSMFVCMRVCVYFWMYGKFSHKPTVHCNVYT